MTLLLALDTSTSIASVALFDGQRVLSETTWLAGREHSTRLLLEVQVALERIGHTSSEVTGVVVACGPGSFTGVRVGVSVAKGIAAARSVPLWGISSLDVTAAPFEAQPLPVRAVVEAGRGRVATALYELGACIQAARLATVDELLTLVDRPTIVVGELSREAREGLAEHEAAQLASAAAGVRRAGLLAELGWRRARAGASGDPRAVDAIYVS